MWAWLAIAVALAGPEPGTALDVRVVGVLAEVTAVRTFTNPLPVAVDADLWIPVPPGAAVDRLVLDVGDRHVESRVEARDRARATWAVAAAQGRVAGLLEEDGAERLHQRIANVPPGAPVRVEVRYALPVDRREGAWELVLPLTTAPRFVPDGVDPVVFADPEEGGERVSVSVSVQAGQPIRWLESPSHLAVAVPGGPTGSLALSDLPPDRDLSIRWALAGVEPQVTAFRGERHGLLLIEAPSDELPPLPAPQDVVLLIDTSDSTSGAARLRAARVVEAVLGSLGPDDRFTLLTFDDRVRGAAVRAPADGVSVPTALAAFDALPVGGGSDLPLGLTMALAVPVPPGRPTSVVLVTDAAVDPGPAREVLAAGRPARVHVVTVGDAPIRGLCEGLARDSGGSCLPWGPEREEGDLSPLLEALRGPVLTGLRVTWDGVEALPSPLPDLYAGRVLRLPVRGTPGATVTVTGTLAGQPWEAQASPQPAPERLLASTWVRDRLDRLERQGGPEAAQEATALALAYQVVGPGTSLVGVDDAVVDPGPVARWTVPSARPGPDDARYTLDGANLSVQAIQVRADGAAVTTREAAVARAPEPERGVRVQRAAPLVPIGLGGLDAAGVALEEVPLTDAPSLGLGPRLARPALRAVETVGEGREPGGAAIERRHTLDHGWANDLQAEAGGALVTAGRGLAGPVGEASLRGPVLRDHAWLAAHTAGDRLSLPGLDATTWAVDAGALAQGGPDHRLQVWGAADGGVAEAGEAEARWGGGAGAASFTVWPDADEQWVGRVWATDRRWGDDRAARQGARLGWSWLGPELGAQVTAVRSRWEAGGAAFESTWLGAAPEASLGRRLRLAASAEAGALLRAEGALSLLSPSLAGWWAAADERARVGLGADRRQDWARALPAPASPAVPRQDTAWVDAAVEPVEDLALGGVAALTRERFAFVAPPTITALPAAPVPEEERALRRLELFVRKVPARRWWLEGRWTWTGGGDPARAADPLAPWVPGYLTGLRPHRLELAAAWDLPTDPFTQRLAGSLAWTSAVPGAAPHAPAPWLAPAWTWSLSLGQDLPLGGDRSARLELGASGARRAIGAGVVPVEAERLLDLRVLEPPWRLTAGASARF